MSFTGRARRYPSRSVSILRDRYQPARLRLGRSFAAAAMDRFGVRRTMALSLAVAAAGVALSPLMYSPWQLVLLWGLVVGLSTGFVGAYLAAYIAARWFHARQRMVVGLLTAANAAGQ